MDGSKQSTKGLDLACTLAKANNAKITGHNVVPKMFAYGIPLTNDFQKKSRIKGERILNASAKQAKKRGIPLSKKIQVGRNIGQTITKYAQDNKFDIVVIGSRGPDPGAEMFIGSVANYLIHKCKIPILVVK